MINSSFILAGNSEIPNQLIIAQLVACRTVAQEVVGSIPGSSSGTYLKKLKVSFYN